MQLNAGRRWARHGGGDLNKLTITYGLNEDGVSRIHTWNSIDINMLTGELVALRDVLQPLEIEAFEHELLDEAAAQNLVGAATWAKIRNTVGHARARDEVVRWRRHLVLEAAAYRSRWETDGPAAMIAETLAETDDHDRP